MVGGEAAAEGEEEGVRRARVAALPRPQAGGGAGQEHSEHGAAAVLTHMEYSGSAGVHHGHEWVIFYSKHDFFREPTNSDLLRFRCP